MSQNSAIRRATPLYVLASRSKVSPRFRADPHRPLPLGLSDVLAPGVVPRRRLAHYKAWAKARSCIERAPRKLTLHDLRDQLRACELRVMSSREVGATGCAGMKSQPPRALGPVREPYNNSAHQLELLLLADPAIPRLPKHATRAGRTWRDAALGVPGIAKGCACHVRLI